HPHLPGLPPSASAASSTPSTTTKPKGSGADSHHANDSATGGERHEPQPEARDVMCLWVDVDYTELDSGERRARKPHKCDECFRTIDPGERYQYWTIAQDGTVETQRMCAHCWNTIILGSAFT